MERLSTRWFNDQLTFFITREEDKCVGCEHAELVHDECDEWWYCKLQDRTKCPYKEGVMEW